MSGGYKIQHGLPADTKLAVAARRAGLPRGAALAVWITLLDHASRNTPRGSIDGIDAEEIAALLDYDASAINTALETFRDKKMISAAGVIPEREYLSPAALRTRKHRAKRADKEDPDDAAAVASRRQRLQQQVLGHHKKRGRTIAKTHPPEILI